MPRCVCGWSWNAECLFDDDDSGNDDDDDEDTFPEAVVVGVTLK